MAPSLENLIAVCWGNEVSSFFAMTAGLAVVDTAAGQAIMGKDALAEHEKVLATVGMKAVHEWREDLPKARGIGGTTQPLGTAMVRCG